MRLIDKISREQAKVNGWFLGNYLRLVEVTDEDARILEECNAMHFVRYDDGEIEVWRIYG